MGKNVISAVSIVLLSAVVSTVNAGELRVGMGEAYLTIQSGIDAAVGGDVVIVGDAVYTGDGNRDIDFKGKAITVRSLNGPENCIIDYQAKRGDGKPYRGLYFHNDETRQSVVEGFTVTNSSGSGKNGLGIVCSGSSPTIRNCIVTRNLHWGIGAGIYLAGSDALVVDCVIHDNDAQYYCDDWVFEYMEGHGGGIYINGGSPTIRNCVISENTAIGSYDMISCNRFLKGYGGGVYINNSQVTIEGCTIRSNSAVATIGGGIYAFESFLTISNSSFINNFAMYSGGGIFLEESGAEISHSIFCGNILYDGMYYRLGSGGGLLCYNSGPVVITNCTFNGNMTSGSNSLLSDNSEVYIRNSIVWDGEESLAISPTSIFDITYSNIEGGWEGADNIDIDPEFAESGYWEHEVNPEDPPSGWVEGDYHLQSEAGRWDPNSLRWVYDDVTSGCIDGGDPNSAWCSELWPHGGRVNIGAYGGGREASMSLNALGSVSDLDCDFVVGGVDFGLFAGEWGYQMTEGGGLRTDGAPWRGDLDRDGFVGIGDLVLFAEEWLLE